MRADELRREYVLARPSGSSWYHVVPQGKTGRVQGLCGDPFMIGAWWNRISFLGSHWPYLSVCTDCLWLAIKDLE